MMDCSKVRDLLSEYLEDSLNREDKEGVSQHLSICKNCAIELRELQALLGEVSSLKKVSAPRDFLESLHRKIEAPPVLERVLQRLFYPWYIKLPLEVGVAIASVILIIYISNYYSLQKQLDLAKLKEIPQTKLEFTKPKPSEIETKQEALPVIKEEKPSLKQATIVLLSKDIENDYSKVLSLINELEGEIVSSSKETLPKKTALKAFDTYQRKEMASPSISDYPPETLAEEVATPVIVNFRIERTKLATLIPKLEIENSLIIEPKEITSGKEDERVSLFLNISPENIPSKEP